MDLSWEQLLLILTGVGIFIREVAPRLMNKFADAKIEKDRAEQEAKRDQQEANQDLQVRRQSYQQLQDSWERDKIASLLEENESFIREVVVDWLKELIAIAREIKDTTAKRADLDKLRDTDIKKLEYSHREFEAKLTMLINLMQDLYEASKLTHKGDDAPSN